MTITQSKLQHHRHEKKTNCRRENKERIVKGREKREYEKRVNQVELLHYIMNCHGLLAFFLLHFCYCKWKVDVSSLLSSSRTTIIKCECVCLLGTSYRVWMYECMQPFSKKRHPLCRRRRQHGSRCCCVIINGKVCRVISARKIYTE